MVKMSLRRGIRTMKERCIKYETEANKLSETISENKQKRKDLRRIIHQLNNRKSEISEIIKRKKEERIQLLQMINEKQQLETRLVEKIRKMKTETIPKWKLYLKQYEDKKTREYDRRMMKNVITYTNKNPHPPPRRRKPLSEMSDDEFLFRFEPWDRDRARGVIGKLREYLTQVHASQGFDVDKDVFPGLFFGVSSVQPLDVKGGVNGAETVDYMWMGNYALSKYNAEHKTNFEYVKLLKTNAIVRENSTFFITFHARDKKMNQGELLTFQAKVGCNLMFPKRKHSRPLVRLKPNV